MRNFTSVEESIDDAAHRYLDRFGGGRLQAGLTEFVVFGLKQAWACVFGAALLAVILGARLWYPDNAGLARNDFLTLAAVVIQVLMIAFRSQGLRKI